MSASRAPLVLALALTLSAAAPAAAQEFGFAAGGGIGVMHSNAVQDDGSLPAIPLLHGHANVALGVAELGVRVGVAHDLLFGRTEYLATPFLGLRWPLGRNVLAASFEAGYHAYTSVGHGFWNDTSSDTASLPSVGGRMMWGHTIGRAPVVLGGALFVLHDLSTTQVSVTTTRCPVTACTLGEVTTYTVGGTMFGAMFVAEFRRTPR